MSLSPKKLYSFKIDPEDADELKRVKEQIAIPESEQIRRGLGMWFRSEELKAAKKRARGVARRRA